MSLNLGQIKGLMREIQPLLTGAVFDYCSAINDRKIIFHFKNQLSLLICFQEPFLRFHLTSHLWKDHPIAFSRLLTQSLHGATLIHFGLLQEDRILQFHFRKNNEDKIFICELIPKRANGYLVNHENKILAALNAVPFSFYTLPEHKNHSTLTDAEPISSLKTEEVYRHLELEDEFIKMKKAAEMQLKNQLKHSQKAYGKISQDLTEALNWENIQHEATLLQSNLFKIQKGMSKVRVNDWLKDNQEIEIELDSTVSPSEEISKRFQKSKKLKRGIEPLQRQLEKIQKNESKTLSLLNELQNISSKELLKSFCQKHYLSLSKEMASKAEKQLPALPFREFVSESGLQIWVGKSAKDNDKLTFTYANGGDYWLHARDVPGSHIVLHLGKRATPDEESLKDAIQAALFYSKAVKAQEGEVCITQCKYVSRFGKNQPGKVQISQHSVVFARIDQNRLKNLRERKKTA